MARMAPSNEYLFRLDQPAMNTDSSVAAPTAKKNNTPESSIQRRHVPSHRHHGQRQKDRHHQHQRREKMDDLIGRVGNDILLRQRFQPVGDRLEEPQGPTRLGP